MRVLSALVLTHCFGCVIPDDSDDEFTIKKSNLSKVKDNLNPMNPRDAKYTENISLRTENPQSVCDATRVENLLNKLTKSPERYVKYRKSHSNDDERSSGRKMDLLSVPEEIADTQNGRLIRHRRRIHRYRHNRHGFHRGFRKSNKKNVLNYCKNDSYDEDEKNKKIKKDEPRAHHPINRRPYETKEIELREEDEGFQEEPEEGWDDWSNWSECSVTCGRGRQVRWRHCATKNCPRGLKVAQMKTCHLQDCSKKGFLKWLGIKL